VKLEGGVHVQAPPTRLLTLATAVPKGERAEWLVEQASQLNVAKLQWLACDRGVVKPREGGAKLDKWRRLAVESAKQCRRLHLMAVEELAGLEEVLKKARGDKILWLEPREGDASAKVAEAMQGWSGNVLALIGPEGGWSQREFALLEAAAQRNELLRVRLTTTVLRIETACAAIAALVMSA
jgi:16S rRNA (uracil1498-N3)-methyltransferase